MGGDLRETVNGYDCQRYRVNVDAKVKRVTKVTKKFEQTYEEYFASADLEKSMQADESQVKCVKDETKHINS